MPQYVSSQWKFLAIAYQGSTSISVGIMSVVRIATNTT
jgi:hypothetical protein